MRKLYNLLISLWTLEGLIAIAVGICLVGSLMLPSHLAFFSGIDDTPLFQWLSHEGKPGITWWIYALITAMGLIALSTALCTMDALLRLKGLKGRKDIMRRLYPQFIHLGVLLVMLGYLMTAWVGTREDVLLKEGQAHELPGGISMTLVKVGIDAQKRDYYDDWVAEISIADASRERTASLRPVEPVREGNVMLFFKSITLKGKGAETSSALIRIVRDPGAPWALAGGLMVVMGGLAFVITRSRPY